MPHNAARHEEESKQQHETKRSTNKLHHHNQVLLHHSASKQHQTHLNSSGGASSSSFASSAEQHSAPATVVDATLLDQAIALHLQQQYPQHVNQATSTSSTTGASGAGTSSPGGSSSGGTQLGGATKDVRLQLLQQQQPSLSQTRQSNAPSSSTVAQSQQQQAVQHMTTLALSFRNLASIDNLYPYSQLTKLQLDNNRLTSIGSGLKQLTNLTWLDLSFNQLQRVEGLETLNKLQDLSLFRNRLISPLGTGLSACQQTLQCLSLGENQLSSLDDVKMLRAFPALRALTLSNNPLTTQYGTDEYQHTVLAYCSQLSHLDYCQIDVASRAQARDNKLDEIVLLEQREKQDAQHAKHMLPQEERRARLRDAGLESTLAHLFSELIQSDTEQSKLRLLPGFERLLAQYEQQCASVLDTACTDLLARYAARQDELQQLNSALVTVQSEAELQSKELVKHYEARRKELGVAWNTALSQEDETEIDAQHAAMTQLASMELPALHDELMSFEMLCKERVASLLDEFEKSYTKLIADNVQRCGALFRALNECVSKHASAMYELVHTLQEHQVRNETSAGGSGGGGAGGNSSMSNAASSTSASAAASASATDADDVDASLQVSAENASALRSLLIDKDGLSSAVSTSKENHESKLAQREDELRERDEAQCRQLLAQQQTSEVKRNRRRVGQILALRQTQRQWLAEQLDSDELRQPMQQEARLGSSALEQAAKALIGEEEKQAQDEEAKAQAAEDEAALNDELAQSE